MRYTIPICTVAVALGLLVVAEWPVSAQEKKYPANFDSVWRNPKAGQRGNPWDITKPMGLGQEAPLTPEYQTLFEAEAKRQREGGQGRNQSARCLPSGMPRAMSFALPMEMIVRPDVTYFLSMHAGIRRIWTDGRRMPAGEPPTFQGYSTGQWLDADNDGTYDTLEVETINFKGPRLYESSGLPLHDDNQTVVKERIFIDKDDPNILRDEITTYDHALTRPWTVMKGYVRAPDHEWIEFNCNESNNHIRIAGEDYFVGGDGKLLPVRPGQAPPDLKNFNRTNVGK